MEFKLSLQTSLHFARNNWYEINALDQWFSTFSSPFILMISTVIFTSTLICTPITELLCCITETIFSQNRLFETPWAVARQAALSKKFSRQEYWSGLPFPSPGNLPDSGIKPRSPAMQAASLQSEAPGKPKSTVLQLKKKKSSLQSSHISHSSLLSQVSELSSWVAMPRLLHSYLFFFSFSFLPVPCVMWWRQWHPLQYSCLENPMGGGAW